MNKGKKTKSHSIVYIGFMRSLLAHYFKKDILKKEFPFCILHVTFIQMRC